MSQHPSRTDEEVRRLELVGSILGRRPTASSDASVTLVDRRLRRRVLTYLRRHPLVPACLFLCFAAWVGLANMAPSETVEALSHDAETGGVHRPPTHRPPDAGPSTAPSKAHRVKRPLSYWLDQLHDDDWRVRSRAAFELVRKSRSSSLVLISLHVVLDDPHAGVRFWAVERFRGLKLHEERVRDEMDGFIGNSELRDLYDELDPRRRQAFEVIVRGWLLEPVDEVRWAGLALCQLLGRRSIVFTSILETIREHDRNVRFRRQASVTLKKIVPPERNRAR